MGVSRLAVKPPPREKPPSNTLGGIRSNFLNELCAQLRAYADIISGASWTDARYIALSNVANANTLVLPAPSSRRVCSGPGSFARLSLDTATAFG